jgi:hypothetical protein
MNTKCATCGAPQLLNDSKTCIYCGDILKSNEVDENFLKDFIPVKYEFNQGNYEKAVKLADNYLEKDLFNIPCWSYKIVSEFFFKSELNAQYDFAILKKSLQSIIDLNITTTLSQKVIENQIISIFEKIKKGHYASFSFRRFDEFKLYLSENFSEDFCNICIEKYNSLFKEYVGEKKINFDVSERDPLFEDAAKLLVEANHASTALIQRKLNIGSNRTLRIMKDLESAMIIGKVNANSQSELLIKDANDLIIHFRSLGIWEK